MASKVEHKWHHSKYKRSKRRINQSFNIQYIQIQQRYSHSLTQSKNDTSSSSSDTYSPTEDVLINNNSSDSLISSSATEEENTPIDDKNEDMNDSKNFQTISECFKVIESDFRRKRKMSNTSNNENTTEIEYKYSDMVKKNISFVSNDNRKRLSSKINTLSFPDKFVSHISSLYNEEKHLHVRSLLKSARYCNIDKETIEKIGIRSSTVAMDDGLLNMNEKRYQLVVIGSYLDELIDVFEQFVIHMETDAIHTECPLDIVYNIAEFVGNPIMWLRIESGLNIFQWSSTQIRPKLQRKKLLLDQRKKKRKKRMKKYKKRKRKGWRKMNVDYFNSVQSCATIAANIPPNVTTTDDLNNDRFTAVSVANAEKNKKCTFDEWYFSGYLGMHEDMIDHLNIDVNTFIMNDENRFHSKIAKCTKMGGEKRSEQWTYDFIHHRYVLRSMDAVDVGEEEGFESQDSLLDLDWCFVAFLLLGLVPRIENDFFRWYFNQKLMSAVPPNCPFKALYSD